MIQPTKYNLSKGMDENYPAKNKQRKS